MSCRGTCEKLRMKKPYGKSHYSVGGKRCVTCSVYLMWDGYLCPCCGYKLRTNPRYLKAKERSFEMQVARH